MEPLTVVKVGGAVVEEPAALDKLLHSFVRLGGRRLLVHGGGRRATKLARDLGIPTQMVGGRRVTDERMLEVVTMTYGGLVNKNIVARLGALGVKAIGLTGADAGIILADKRPPVTITNAEGKVETIDFGYVGDVRAVDGEALRILIEQGLTPVVAPVTCDGQGGLLNTNADTIAASVAVALAKYYDVTLVYAFEKNGVLRDETDATSVIPVITRAGFARLAADGTISGGMLPKIENALAAVDNGVGEVRITSAGNLSGGTAIRASHSV
ncbi:MAG: acetylglutamate kinase [Prevotella sp.]|nr:acetylglutamate kinase [Prevotella sp.]